MYPTMNADVKHMLSRVAQWPQAGSPHFGNCHDI